MLLELTGQRGPFQIQYVFLLFVRFCLFRAIPAAYGGSQARGRIGAVASGLHHSSQQRQIHKSYLLLYVLVNEERNEFFTDWN